MQKKSAKSYNRSRAFKLSRDAVRKINAVEGIDLDGQVSRQLEEFDKQNLSPAQRRKAVREKFAKASA